MSEQVRGNKIQLIQYGVITLCVSMIWVCLNISLNISNHSSVICVCVYIYIYTHTHTYIKGAWMAQSV